MRIMEYPSWKGPQQSLRVFSKWQNPLWAFPHSEFRVKSSLGCPRNELPEETMPGFTFFALWAPIPIHWTEISLPQAREVTEVPHWNFQVSPGIWICQALGELCCIHPIHTINGIPTAPAEIPDGITNYNFWSWNTVCSMKCFWCKCSLIHTHPTYSQQPSWGHTGNYCWNYRRNLSHQHHPFLTRSEATFPVYLYAELKPQFKTWFRGAGLYLYSLHTWLTTPWKQQYTLNMDIPSWVPSSLNHNTVFHRKKK